LRIDSHHHLTPDYSASLLWPILKRNRVEASVLVSQAGTVEETRWLLEQAAHHDYIRAVVGWADSESPDLGRLLDEYQRHPKFRGLRLPAADALPAGLAEVERRGLTLDIDPRLDFPPRILDRHPGLKIVIDHLGRPALAPFEEWARALEDTARDPRVFAKISGLITGIPGRWKADQFQPYARHVLRAFGPHRVMFGSDWPSYLPEGTWKEAMAAFTQAIGAQTLETREHLLGATAARFYRIDTGASA